MNELYEKPDTDLNLIHEISWIFVVLRILQLSETVFFVLRKKQHQITFLHVYHQITSILVFWSFLKFSGGIMEVYMILVSEIAQIIKYSYFLLSLYTNVTRIYIFLKRIKPALVLLQIFQLLFNLIQSIVAVREDCNASKVFHLQIFNIIVLIILYIQFFIKNYLKRYGIKY